MRRAIGIAFLTTFSFGLVLHNGMSREGDRWIAGSTMIYVSEFLEGSDSDQIDAAIRAAKAVEPPVVVQLDDKTYNLDRPITLQ